VSRYDAYVVRSLIWYKAGHTYVFRVPVTLPDWKLAVLFHRYVESADHPLDAADYSEFCKAVVSGLI
jgi:hypothetical protein